MPCRPTSRRRSSAYSRGQEPLERDLGVAVERLAVGEGELRALDHHMDVLGVRQLREFEAVEQRELLEEDRALAPRRPSCKP